MAERKSIRKATAPSYSYQPQCFNTLVDNGNDMVEINPELIRTLPNYHGREGEDPNKFLHDFHIKCASMKPAGMKEELLRMKVFTFCMKEEAKDWFYYLSPGSVSS